MLFNWPFSKIRRHRCPDGDKIVYKSVDDAFPLFIPEWKGQIDSSIEALKKVSARIRTEYATMVRGLLYSVDDLNQDLMLRFRAVYVVYQHDPCNQAGFLQRQIEKMLNEQHGLRMLRVQIQALIRP
jgi:hypothetical protein